MKYPFIIFFLFFCQRAEAQSPFPQQLINETLQKAWDTKDNPMPQSRALGQPANSRPSGIYHLLQEGKPGQIAAKSSVSGSQNILYVGATPHDTLIVTGTWQHNGWVAVINDGVLIFNNAYATISGFLIATGEGKVIAANSTLYFPQQYFYQWGLQADRHGLIQMKHCTLDFAGLAHMIGTGDSATINLQNVHFTDFTSTIGLNGHSKFIVDTANLLGEIVATDSVLLSLKNVDTVIVWHRIQRGAGLTKTFPNGYNVQHYAIGPDSPGVNGLRYTIELDNIKKVNWALMPEDQTNVHISNSTIRSVAVIYKGTETGTAHGLVDNSNYVTSPTFFSDRTFQLTNCSVQTWGVYPTDTTHVDITSCILGEIGTGGHAHTSCSSMFADGSGGYFWANASGFQSASGCGFNCPVRAEQGGIAMVGFCSISAATGYAVDSGMLIMVQTPTISPPIAYDGAVVWVGMLSPQAADSGSIVSLTGSAYILRGPTSHLMSFASYYIAYQLAGTNTWTITDAIHTTPVTQGTMVNWNTTGIATGHYNMLLVIKDNFGDSVIVNSGLDLRTGTSTGIVNIQNSDVKIYPNPVNNSIDISIKENMIGATATVTDMTGRVVANVILSTNNYELSTGNFSKGIYIMQLKQKDRTWTKKFVKE
ncbi:MAG: hypothetical protein JWN78_494 [Bacteroidota bacterium]|nr:hypothetical protein [Bacteroidota bacterium]